MNYLRTIFKYLLAIGFVLAGVNHFINSSFYLRMMPPILPAPLFLIYLSGVFQIALGILLLLPKFTQLAAWGMIALLVAVFPANVFMASNPEAFSEFTPMALYIRLPVQSMMIAWAYWFTRRADKNAEG